MVIIHVEASEVKKRVSHQKKLSVGNSVMSKMTSKFHNVASTM